MLRDLRSRVSGEGAGGNLKKFKYLCAVYALILCFYMVLQSLPKGNTY